MVMVIVMFFLLTGNPRRQRAFLGCKESDVHLQTRMANALLKNLDKRYLRESSH